MSLLINVTSGEMAVFHEPLGSYPPTTPPYPCNLSALATLHRRAGGMLLKEAAGDLFSAF